MLDTDNAANHSMVYRVLSPVTIPPLDLGEKLSIFNNDFHPSLSPQGASDFLECSNQLHQLLITLVNMRECLAQYPIKMNEFNLALNYLYGYEFIVDVTLQIPNNARMVAYAQSKKAVQS